MMDQLQADLEQYRGRDGFIHLKRKYSTLFEKTNYTTELPFIINRIIEYDLRQPIFQPWKPLGNLIRK